MLFKVQHITVKKHHFYGFSVAGKNQYLSQQVSAYPTDHVYAQVSDIKVGVYNK